MDQLAAALKISGSGMQAQSTRMRIVSENLANAQSTGRTPGADPYRRKTVTFAEEMDRAMGTPTVVVKDIGADRSPFEVTHDPGNPAADANGNVKMPNVNVLIELSDLRQANRSYSANVEAITQARSMLTMNIDLLRNS
ncbi:flagellar basal body rod protein FlgC [Pleomorphomonas diazotrophica]|uniref:Flagellar basal-body rod protein FlgC n=1 Tax=Pleomorphomonas diazotrophica TaxID=1166257 RepID=A0A1I4QFG4_9HYPH|nr:flagellar basal body rod protein FlgC [Pleomorphomonas diazotrophica]PKR90694.1 flagellar basal body rod protein FlgC [Pleomorphomonas diazotrophica]SFM38862.1 flagellar basal-body rod protein FlgC [Pleomorphomonas diazotrophica]